MAAFETGVSIIAGTGGVIGVDFNQVILDALHQGAPEIGNILEEFVRARTHILTGALQESMTHLDWPNVNKDEDITFVFARELEQIQEWNRVYVQYQEGGLLGAPTWTNSPVEMFFQTADNEGPVAVEAWALARIQAALTIAATGGIP